MKRFKFLLTIITCWAFQLTAQNSEPSRLYIPYREGNLWGYCDTLGNVLLKPQYDSTGFFDVWEFAAAIFKKDGKYGVLNQNFKEIVPAKHVYLKLPWCCWSYRIISIQRDSKIGVINTLDSEKLSVIPAQFDSVDFKYAHIGYIIVSLNGKRGLYNRMGQKLSEPEFDEFEPAEDFWDLQNSRGMVGRKKDVYFHIKPGSPTVELKNSRRTGVPVPDQKEFDKKNKDKVTAWQKQYLQAIEDSLQQAGVISRILYDRGADYVLGQYQYVLAKKKKKVALISTYRGTVSSAFYNDIAGAISLQRPEIIDIGPVGPVEEKALPLYSQLLFVKKGKKYGVVSEKGTVIFPFVYDGFEEVSATGVVTRQKNKYGIINAFTFYPPIACKYDQIAYYRSLPVKQTWAFTIYKVSSNGRDGYVGENGKEYFKNE